MTEPGADCQLCPRLAAFRTENRQNFASWHNAPVPAFGPLTARLLVVGLAPGLRGANATGRPFTGDWAGDLLYGTLLAKNLAQGAYAEHAKDGLILPDVRITNAVRCVPPGNRPTATEAGNCRPYLVSELALMGNLKVVIAIGGFAHDAILAAKKLRKAPYPFAHGQVHLLPDGLYLLDSYHCSRLNTNTGRLTEPMFHAVFDAALSILAQL
ncbi:MAG TPA: uracil-DNA glycosylase [Rhodospirillaceae bacterium]|nr:uracil-DNA glycosylase [Rhodospirillaceae bacterium]